MGKVSNGRKEEIDPSEKNKKRRWESSKRGRDQSEEVEKEDDDEVEQAINSCNFRQKKARGMEPLELNH